LLVALRKKNVAKSGDFGEGKIFLKPPELTAENNATRRALIRTIGLMGGRQRRSRW